MKAALAKKLVADLMEWSDDRATDEFQWLELMVGYKFDHYQQYGAGRRFYIHLIRWISHFAVVEREFAWRLLRHKLVYVSQKEMQHLVGLTGPMIEREMRAAIAKRLSIPVYKVYTDLVAQRALEVMRCRTLYVGMSDGARIDLFRRENEGVIDNDQVVPMIEIAQTKQLSLREELGKRLIDLGSDAPNTFEWVCLIDDFTASGTTAIRKTEKGWNGKVNRFMQVLGSDIGDGQRMTAPGAHVMVHHYLASSIAEVNVKDRLREFGKDHAAMRFFATFGHVLPATFPLTCEPDEADLVSFLDEHYDPSIETDDTGRDIALGYKQCGLPLILEHNTPNNSVATLWARSVPTKPTYRSDKDMVPLFPRRQRH